MTSPAWLAAGDALRDHPAVFIAGVPRSGTTVLAMTLGTHPSFRGKPKILHESKVFQRPETLTAPGHRNARRLVSWFGGDALALERFLERAHAFAARVGPARVALAGWVARREGDRRCRALAWRLLRRDRLCRAFFAESLVRRGARRLVEKTPGHARCVPEILATFPRARFVFAVRHPLDVFASHRKRLRAEEARGSANVDWLRVTPEHFVTRYSRLVEAALAHLDLRRGDALLVRYEDLTARPEAELERLHDFLGEEFPRRRLLERKAVRVHASGTLSPTGRIGANRGRSADFVDAATARGLEDALERLMARLGYARRTARDGGEKSGPTGAAAPPSA